MAQKCMGFVSVLDKEQSPRSFLRMEKWIFDSPDQAGEAFRQFINVSRICTATRGVTARRSSALPW